MIGPVAFRSGVDFFEALFECDDVGRHLAFGLSVYQEWDEESADAVSVEVDGGGDFGPCMVQGSHRDVDSCPDGPVDAQRSTSAAGRLGRARMYWRV